MVDTRNRRYQVHVSVQGFRDKFGYSFLERLNPITLQVLQTETRPKQLQTYVKAIIDAAYENV